MRLGGATTDDSTYVESASKTKRELKQEWCTADATPGRCAGGRNQADTAMAATGASDASASSSGRYSSRWGEYSNTWPVSNL